MLDFLRLPEAISKVNACSAVLYVSAALLWVLVLLPCIVFLCTTWSVRRDRLAAIGGAHLGTYLQLFHPAIPIAPGKEKETYQKRFSTIDGKRHYILPLFLLAVTAGLGLFFVAASIVQKSAFDTQFFRQEPKVIFSFLGGYFWTLLDQVDRHRSRDFSPHELYHGVYRIVISIPVGLALSVFVNQEIADGLAFALSAFPMATINDFFKSILVNRLGVGEAGKTSPCELIKLQGVDVPNAERFKKEGITSIVQLAWADPIEMTVRTNLDFSYVTDCISQALLWIYFVDRSKDLVRFGLRGSQEIQNLLAGLDSGDAHKKNRADATLQSVASELNMQPDALRRTMLEVAEDPFAKLLRQLWYSAPTTATQMPMIGKAL